jgi:glutaredoxin
MMIVYTKDNCPACNNLKQTLLQNGVVYKEIKIGRDISREEFMDTFPNIRSVPHTVEVEDL